MFFRKNKYGSKITEVDGIKFHSKKEAHYYIGLKMRLLAKDIRSFHLQVPYKLPGKIKYYLDFLVENNDGTCEYIDVKGFATNVYKNKKKQVEEIYGIKIREV